MNRQRIIYGIGFAIGLVLFIGSPFAVYWLLFLFVAFLKETNPALAAAIIAAAGTVLTGIIAPLIAKQYENKQNLKKEHRERKIPFYEKFISFLFQLLLHKQLKIEELTPDEAVKNIVEFSQQVLIWGSDEVIALWPKLKNQTGQTADTASVLGEMLLAIRKDLGHSNKGLDRKSVLRIFINDIDQVMK